MKTAAKQGQSKIWNLPTRTKNEKREKKESGGGRKGK